MKSSETHVGTSVRVLDGERRNGKGSFGIIERTYGHPDYRAVEVRFGDGDSGLYWHHELALEGEAKRSPAGRPV